jgi:hypothetical protein
MWSSYCPIDRIQLSSWGQSSFIRYLVWTLVITTMRCSTALHITPRDFTALQWTENWNCDNWSSPLASAFSWHSICRNVPRNTADGFGLPEHFTRYERRAEARRRHPTLFSSCDCNIFLRNFKPRFTAWLKYSIFNIVVTWVLTTNPVGV